MGLNRLLSVFNTSLAAIAFLTFASAAWAASAKGGTEYLGGTFRSIQPSARGTLDLGDPEELAFHSNDSTLRLPYSRIRDFHFTEFRKHARRFAGVRLPAINFIGHDRTLELSFQELDGALGTASFRVDEKTWSEAQPLLAERITPGKPPRHSSGVKLTEAWWGDKYWKTTRNKPAWPDPPAVEPPVSLTEPRP